MRLCETGRKKNPSKDKKERRKHAKRKLRTA